MPDSASELRNVFGHIWALGPLRALPPLTLAYVGDAVYELYVRVALAEGGLTRTNSMHKQAVSRVRAQAQASILRSLLPTLSEEELSIAKRGRNAKGGSVPKGASVADYRLATGFEAMVGYLFLSGRESRIKELLDEAERVGGSDALSARTDKELTKA